eukprot:gb/GECG01006174.1/.p1 GENE.gb/GECG01006174.1/~~gb/GECG01006174.1/.p1  ORF type:complete len:103 (+),score=10.24 gb/GECG01006174.1/:1-309(+)
MGSILFPVTDPQDHGTWGLALLTLHPHTMQQNIQMQSALFRLFEASQEIAGDGWVGAGSSLFTNIETPRRSHIRWYIPGSTTYIKPAKLWTGTAIGSQLFFV